METAGFLKRPPRSSNVINKDSQRKTLSPTLNKTRFSTEIGDIIEKEHAKLQQELNKLTSLRQKTNFSPMIRTEVSSENSSDIEEFVSVPFSPKSKLSLKINSTVHKENAVPSKEMHKALTKNDSTSSGELLLSTYEDSILYSPPHCMSPTYCRRDFSKNTPKSFFKQQSSNVFSTSYQESSAGSLSSNRSQLIDRLSYGKKDKISRKEMRERNERLYKNLPEVKERMLKEQRDNERKINAMYAKGLQEKLKKDIRARITRQKK